MSSAEVIAETFAALDAGDYETAAGLLDREFEFSGPTLQPLGAKEFIAFESALRSAMPNLKHNCLVYSTEDGDWVRGQVQIAGTHRRPLDLPNLPILAATRKRVKLPAERFVAVVRDGRIVSFAADVGPDGGLMGILKQLGRDDLADCVGAGGRDCIEESFQPGVHV